MSIHQLLQSMCADLADVDLNAIRKARGFSTQETASRDSFASFFVSSIGVQEAMQSLTPEESTTLHLLHRTGEVDITFFERLYGSAVQKGMQSYFTYTQQYKSTLDAVKKNLVRKGLLVIAEIKMRGETVQMARWRFALPPEFAAYLPPTLHVKSSDLPGETSDTTLRKKLLQLVGAPALPHDSTPLFIIKGDIWLGEQPYSVASLREWQTLAWQNALGVPKYSNTENFLVPTQAVLSLLAGLAPGEWAPAKSMDPALKIYCFGGKIPSAEKILREGWQLGLLSRLNIDSEPHYRLISQEDPGGVSAMQSRANDALPASVAWLKYLPKTNSVKIDLGLIPLYHLETLNCLVHLDVENDVLLASVSPVKLGRASPTQRQSPLSLWWVENIPSFEKAFTAVNQRWGKTLLHENLLVARVRDLSLRVQLERELGQKIIILSESFIAFPAETRPSVEKVLKKLGFVTKIIRP